jgi:hypothetical protein
MNESFPFVEIANGVMSIHFMASSPVRSLTVSCVIDYSDFGDLVGIELLDWRRQLSGGQLDVPSSSGQLRWSYDDEIDALYLHTSDARGENQQRTTATVQLDALRRVVALTLVLPTPVTR